MIRVVVFDAYGTLLDVHSAIARHAARVGPAHTAVSSLWRQKQLEATWILSAVGDYAPFEELTDRALGFALAAHGIIDDALRADLLLAYRALDAFADTVPVLHALRERGLRTATFSNGSPEMLQAGIAAAGLDGLLHDVLSVHRLRCFKPAPRVYRHATDHFGCQPHEVAFVSANAWDAFGAARFGWRTFWLNRAGAPTEYWLDDLAVTLQDMHALPGAIR